jgi:hypothetical protein
VPDAVTSPGAAGPAGASPAEVNSAGGNSAAAGAPANAHASSAFRVVARQDGAIIKSTQASVPEQTWRESPWWREGIRQVRLSAKSKSAIYEILIRQSAQGHDIWLADGQLGLAHLEASPVVIEASSKFRFDLQSLMHTGYGQLLIVGLCIGLLGIATDAALEAGKRGFVLFRSTDLQLFIAYLGSVVLKAVGLLATFLTATFFKKD